MFGMLVIFIAMAICARAQEKTEDDRVIDGILNLKKSETDMAKALMDAFPKLTKAGQEEAMAHILNFLDDAHYDIALKTLLNPKTHADVLELMLTDLHSRDDAVKLPTLLKIAKTQGHPLREDAAVSLEVFLDEDFKEDWAKWQAAIDQYLAAQKAIGEKREPAPEPPAKK